MECEHTVLRDSLDQGAALTWLVTSEALLNSGSACWGTSLHTRTHLLPWPRIFSLHSCLYPHPYPRPTAATPVRGARQSLGLLSRGFRCLFALIAYAGKCSLPGPNASALRWPTPPEAARRSHPRSHDGTGFREDPRTCMALHPAWRLSSRVCSLAVSALLQPEAAAGLRKCHCAAFDPPGAPHLTQEGAKSRDSPHKKTFP